MKVEIILGIMLVLLVLCGLFFVFEKPLRRRFFRWYERRFQKRTGINPSKFPNPFE